MTHLPCEFANIVSPQHHLTNLFIKIIEDVIAHM